MQRKNRFLEEIEEQPEALRRLADYYASEGRRRLQEWAGLALKSSAVTFGGMGTSYFAPLCAEQAMAKAGAPVCILDAGEWLHYPRPVRGLCALISQSGESVETRRLAARLARANRLVAVTNNEKSALGRSAALVLPMCAGAEESISTKTYTNTLGVLALMAAALLGAAALKRAIGRLRALADAMPTRETEDIRMAADLLADAASIHFVSRGPAMASAMQGALTFMEGARVPAAAFTGGAFRHGPFELVDKRFRAVFMAPKGPGFALLERMAFETAEKGGKVVFLADTATALKSPRIRTLRTPECEEQFFPLAAATTQELLLAAAAAGRGLRPGKFRYGGKITARE